MKEKRWVWQLRRYGRRGSYVIKAAESRPASVEPRTPPAGYKPPSLSPAQRKAARALLALKRPTSTQPAVREAA